MNVLTVTGPIYLLMALGFLAVRTGAFESAQLAGLGRFVVLFALPATIFSAIATTPVEQVFVANYLLGYIVLSLLMIALTFTIFKVALRHDTTRSGVLTMGAAAGNSGFVGLPIYLMLIPEHAGVVFAMNVLVENVLLIPIMLTIMGLGSDQGRPMTLLASALGRTLRNPVFIAALAGLVWSLLGLPLPGVVDRSFTLIAAALTATGLIFAGGSIVGLQVRPVIKPAVQVAALKLLVLPALAAGTVAVLSLIGLALAPPLAAGLIVTAALPSVTIWTIFAATFGHGMEASGIFAFVYVVSFPTLTAVIAISAALGWA